MKCLSCKFWKQESELWEDWKLEHMKEGFVFGVCDKIGHRSYYGDNEKSLDIANTSDGSDYHSQLNTRSDFGCSLFEGEDK